MLYEVRLKASYAYGSPVSGGRHVLRMMPRDIPGLQRVIVAALDIDPKPRARHDLVDFFGNRTTIITLADSHEEVSFLLRARVERIAPPPALDISPPLAKLADEVAAVTTLDGSAPHHFLSPSPLIAPSALIRDYVHAFAQDFVQSDQSVQSLVAALNQRLYDDMKYDSEATDVETPLEEAFQQRRGVCQDFSHIMIACLRELGIPAGYVSGFLRTEPPPGQPRLEGADAMHAWVMAWCGREIGWVEFDPTNALRVANDHVVAARGRDYSDVSPVRGVLWTSASQTTHQAVDLIPVDP